MDSLEETKTSSPGFDSPTSDDLLWKVNEQKSLKSGPHNSVFWVKNNPRFEKAVKEGDANKERFSKFRTGNTYTGEWESNQKHGFGTQLWSCGKKYEGDWHNGQRSGRGTLWKVQTTESGNRESVKVYTGSWKHNKCHGMGTRFYTKLKYSPCDDPDDAVEGSGRYDGEWRLNMRHGRGEMVYPNGDRYEGSWKDNKRNGLGRLTTARGDVYQGSWERGLKHGVGCFFYVATGKVYEGEWHEGTPTCGEFKDLSALDSTVAMGLVGNIGAIVEPVHAFTLPPLGLKDPDVVLSTILSRENRDHK